MGDPIRRRLWTRPIGKTCVYLVLCVAEGGNVCGNWLCRLVVEIMVIHRSIFSLILLSCAE